MFSLVNPIAPPPYAPVTSLSVIERFDAVSTRPGRQAPSIGRCCADSTPSIGDHRFDERVKERVKNRCHRSFGFARSLFLFPPASSPPCFFIPPFFPPALSFSIRSIFLVVDARHDASVRRRGVKIRLLPLSTTPSAHIRSTHPTLPVRNKSPHTHYALS